MLYDKTKRYIEAREEREAIERRMDYDEIDRLTASYKESLALRDCLDSLASRIDDIGDRVDYLYRHGKGLI